MKFNYIFFILIFSINSSELFTEDQELKDHLVVLFSSKEDRENFLNKLKEIEQLNKIKIHNNALILTSYPSIYGAKIPFSPAMNKLNFDKLINEHINQNLTVKAYAYELKSGIVYSKIEAKFSSLSGLVEFIMWTLYSCLKIKSIEFPGNQEGLPYVTNLIIYFNPVPIDTAAQAVNQINSLMHNKILFFKISTEIWN